VICRYCVERTGLLTAWVDHDNSHSPSSEDIRSSVLAWVPEADQQTFDIDTCLSTAHHYYVHSSWRARTACPPLYSTVWRHHGLGKNLKYGQTTIQNRQSKEYTRPFDAHCCHMGTAIKHPVPDRVKPSFVIFDIRAHSRSAVSALVPGCQKLRMTV